MARRKLRINVKRIYAIVIIVTTVSVISLMLYIHILNPLIMLIFILSSVLGIYMNKENKTYNKIFNEAEIIIEDLLEENILFERNCGIEYEINSIISKNQCVCTLERIRGLLNLIQENGNKHFIEEDRKTIAEIYDWFSDLLERFENKYKEISYK